MAGSEDQSKEIKTLVKAVGTLTASVDKLIEQNTMLLSVIMTEAVEGDESQVPGTLS